MLLKRLALCLLLCLPSLVWAEPEVHAVGVYEGSGKDPAGALRGPDAKVLVDRPGAEVTLYLGSYEPVRWLVTTSPGTEIVRIVIHGYQVAESQVLVNDRQWDKVERADIPYAYASEGKNFRALVDAVTEDGSALASFTGSYRAPAQGFTVSQVVRGIPQFRADYLKDEIAPAASVPESLRGLLDWHGSANAPAQELSFEGDGFVIRMSDRPETLYRVPPSLPEVSRPVGATRDPETGMLYGVTFGGEGYLYRYDPKADEWSEPISMLRDDASGLFFDDQSGRVVAVISGLVSRGGMALRVFEDDGSFHDVPLDALNLPGVMDLVDVGNELGPTLLPLGTSEGKVLLLATSSRWRAGFPGEDEPFRIYLVEIESGAASLVSADYPSLGAD